MYKKDLPPLFKEFTALDENILGVGQGNKWIRGQNTSEKAIIVLVRKKLRKDNLQRGQIIPRRADGIVTDVIEVGDLRLHNNTRTSKLRPAQPGISLGHYKISAGTFGAVVKDRKTGEALLLSNNHVLANLTDGNDERSKIGDPILQPGVFDGGDKEKDVIATLHRYIPLYRELAKPKCPIARYFEKCLNTGLHYWRPHYHIQVLREDDKVNIVDCAVAKPLDINSLQSSILELGEIAGVSEAYPIMPVKKSGRSTGVTQSIILAVDVSVKVFMSNREYGIFADQIIAGPMSMPGDSGSLVLSEDNQAIGLLFGGSEQATIINKMQNVLDALDITL